MANLIDNSDNDSNITIVWPFNRFEADFAYDFENEFETHIRNEIREEVTDQHQRDLRVVYDELEQVQLKLSATRRELFRAHIRIRAPPLPLQNNLPWIIG